MSVLDNVLKEIPQIRFIDLDSPNIEKLDIGSTSKGNQAKYYDYFTNEYIKEQFFYKDVYWKDYMVEHLSSVISKELHTNVQIVQQEVVILSNGLMGCVSKDFLKDDSLWIPLKRTGCYEECRRLHKKPYDMFLRIISYFLDYNLDLTEYLIVMSVMDFLLGNEDRHFNNFGVVQSKDGLLEVSPLFDFGLGLFEHDTDYRIVNLYTAKLKMEGKPFNKDLREFVDILYSAGLGSRIESIFKDISIPNRELFPNELGYKYFVESFEYLKGKF